MHCSITASVIRISSGVISPFITAISRVLSAVLASPLEKAAIAASCCLVIPILWFPYPLGFDSACSNSSMISCSVSSFSTNTRHLERSAALISKDGFSVVAPIRRMLPFSTNGRNASCCALLKRWISSTNTTVRIPIFLLFSACSIT